MDSSTRKGPATPERVDGAGFQTSRTQHSNPVDPLLARL